MYSTAASASVLLRKVFGVVPLRLGQPILDQIDIFTRGSDPLRRLLLKSVEDVDRTCKLGRIGRPVGVSVVVFDDLQNRCALEVLLTLQGLR